MPAEAADVARYTSDGIVVTVHNLLTKQQDPNASDTDDRGRELFYDTAENGQLMIAELFGFIGQVGRPHEAIETGDTLGLGSEIPVAPAAPRAQLLDNTRSLDALSVVRAYSFDMGSDSYAIEFVGLRPAVAVPNSPVFDTTGITFDNDGLKWDRTS